MRSNTIVCMADLLNEAQFVVLRWVADGCPDGVMEGYAHRVSAAALRNRDLIRISGRGRTWHATLTDAGRIYLSSPPPPRRRTPRPARSAQVPKSETPPTALPPAPSISDPIAEDLRGAHPLVRATQAASKGLRPGPDGRLTIGDRPGVLRMVVSREQLHRALVLAHSTIVGAKRRGWDIKPYSKEHYGPHPGVAIVIRDHRYPVEVHEQARTLPFTEEEIDAWRNEYSWDRRDRANKMPPPQCKRKEPTGRLQLVLPTGYGGGRATWTDSPRSLNGSLSEVFDWLEQRASADDLAAENARQRREEFERAEELRAERARLARIEEARAKRAAAEIAAWRQAHDLRDYAAVLREHLPQLDQAERDRVEAWCQWLEDRARRSDPTKETSLIRGFDDERDGWGW